MGPCNLCFNLWVVLVHLKLENHGHRVCNIIEGAFREISGYPRRERSEQAEKSRKNLTKLTRPQGASEKVENSCVTLLVFLFCPVGPIV